MKSMQKMMEGMMPVMMKGVSPEEKQEMMLKMMPMMMEDIDMEEMMPKMMASMLPALLPQILDLLSQEDAGDKLLDTMSRIMPNLCEVIDKKALAEKKDAMVSNLMKREAFRERMPRCFAKGMPLMVKGCFEHFFPELSREERKEFISSLVRMMVENGTHDFSEEEKQELMAEG